MITDEMLEKWSVPLDERLDYKRVKEKKKLEDKQDKGKIPFNYIRWSTKSFITLQYYLLNKIF
jgi:hypothetical protein